MEKDLRGNREFARIPSPEIQAWENLAGDCS
jgi:hypothetical protein